VKSEIEPDSNSSAGELEAAGDATLAAGELGVGEQADTAAASPKINISLRMKSPI
jgi:hypothetical protein